MGFELRDIKQSMNIIIQLLTKDLLEQTVHLVSKIFDYEPKQYVRETIEEALDFSPRSFSDGFVCTSLEYLIALDTENIIQWQEQQVCILLILTKKKLCGLAGFVFTLSIVGTVLANSF
jgi:hypothetical protein